MLSVGASPSHRHSQLAPQLCPSIEEIQETRLRLRPTPKRKTLHESHSQHALLMQQLRASATTRRQLTAQDLVQLEERRCVHSSPSCATTPFADHEHTSVHVHLMRSLSVDSLHLRKPYPDSSVYAQNPFLVQDGEHTLVAPSPASTCPALDESAARDQYPIVPVQPVDPIKSTPAASSGAVPGIGASNPQNTHSKQTPISPSPSPLYTKKRKAMSPLSSPRSSPSCNHVRATARPIKRRKWVTNAAGLAVVALSPVVGFVLGYALGSS
ncbi:hypothetical protein BJ741DRAFT_634134 [Chytriomyces cf. hyalinus JEL632]|nr:hypothetical protein BJ741DRAFT_634134 [Chytriomyces cf. hyalinus JEL632]